MTASPALKILDLPRRERRKLEVRTRILEASAELFAQQGVQATKVADICRRADVAHKTFFNHFPTKQDMVHALALEGVEGVLRDIEAARRQGGNTRERLTLFFAGIVARTAEVGAKHRELLTEIIHAAQTSGSEPEQARRLHDAFGAIVDDGLEAGDVTRRHSADTMTEMILGAYYALMFNWANLESYPIERQAPAAAALLADALEARSEESPDHGKA